MKVALATFCLILFLTLPTRGESLPRAVNVEANSASLPVVKTEVTIKAWPQEASDLKADPHAVWGKLDNGLRYVILPSDAPGRASLQLYMNVGSLMEADDQRGMAHFLEHMAFNGTKRFPAGEMIEYFQRLGMSFVVHTNAGTDFEKTVYKLELPRTNEEMTGEGLKLFRDFLDGMLLEKKEIERERRVILSEILARNSSEERATLARLTFTLPDTLMPRRWTSGTPETVRALAPQRFVDFYETWYTPGRAVVVASGKFDAPMVERLIRRNFQDAKARRGEQADPVLGKVLPPKGTVAKLYADRDAQATVVTLRTITPRLPAGDSVAERRKDLPLETAIAILNNRFDKLAHVKDAPFQSAGALQEQLFNIADANSVTAVCQPSQRKAAIGVLEQELRRAMKFGFTDTEFKEVNAATLASCKSDVEQADTRLPGALTEGIVSTLARNLVFTHPLDELALVKQALATMTREECEQALRQVWDKQDLQIWVQGNFDAKQDGAEQILEEYRLSQTVAVLPPSDEKAVVWTYTDFGPAGEIVKRQTERDLDFVEAVFANNVRVNVKRTALEKNNVRVLVHFGGGFLEMPAAKPGLSTLASSVFMGGGLEGMSILELRDAIGDKNVSVAFGIGEDAFELGGNCSPAALEMQMQVCAAYLTAPGYRPEAYQRFLGSLDALYAGTEHTVGGVLDDRVTAFLHSNDPRIGLPSREAMQKLTVSDVKSLLAKPLATGYMEVAIVGDIDPEQALQLVAKTLGALPQRDAVKPSFAEQRVFRFPATPKAKEFQFTSETPMALSFVCWPITGHGSTMLDRRIGALASVLNDRLRIKVRQELGATYTPSVLTNSSETFPDYGYLAAVMTVEPTQVGEIGRLAAQIAADLAAGSISDDEFERTMKPLLSSIDDLSNDYWVNLLSHCQEHPEMVDIARGRKADYASIKKSDLEALAKQILAEGRATIINVAPTGLGK